ncbi:MAG: peptidylprolyl isomerase, partial [Bryobacteraceae bacterium]
MNTRLACTLGLLLSLPSDLRCQNVTGPTVRFNTTLGNIDVTLLTAAAPRTVANFLTYVNRGAFNNSIFHRSPPGFVIQGGGYQWQNNLVEIPSDPPIRNEYSTSNTRGTLAMAKLGGMPNSATNQWFFNLGDNSRNLNNTNGGYTVFGRISNP